MSRTVPLTVEATRLFREALNNPVRPIDTDLIFFGEPGRDNKRRALQLHDYGEQGASRTDVIFSTIA
nr:hypothetical protein [Sinimarinibacterium sp. NLF-5-8]